MRGVVSEAVASEVGGVAVTPGNRAAAREASRPYRQSWLDSLYDWIGALPGPTWLAYLLLAIASVVLSNSAIWLSGIRPVGDLDPSQVVWGLATVGIVAGSHGLKIVAGAAFDRFRPALGTGVADPERARYELTVMPVRAIVAITAFSIIVTPAYYAADPVASQVVGLTPIGLIPRALSESLTSVALLAILYQAIRQMRIVRWLHAAADRVDPFRPAPLYAFSQLTAVAGMILIGFNVVGLFASPAILESSSVLLFVPWLAVFTIVAVAVFVVPLVGMHGRLDQLKADAESAADGRMRDLIGELNEAIDARATDRVEALDKTISALRHEREILAKLPTWPWSGATIRGFASALFLPIALFLIQRVLSQVLA